MSKIREFVDTLPVPAGVKYFAGVACLSAVVWAISSPGQTLIQCSMGITACLNYKGKVLMAEDAGHILDTCSTMDRYPPSSFEVSQKSNEFYQDSDKYLRDTMGYYRSLLLEEDGLVVNWNTAADTGVDRRLSVLEACREFRDEYWNTDAAWDHLDKWPWK